ncbi:RluA family pseudouridine synthase [Lactiplantibacillus fabifermentans]|uniref:RNA pseudouridylate synthase n=2 Tax=Lactiplantibacillus fabifermentans TaxID=483011 RepID=A0A0R2NTV0_9LACO|nr:RluA family pseudouridine synthase [Lactiplantibacillus fabifermentans]ETY73552.1 pseudouridine synthase [Lactiplantibacillus fabifermentans T30PCM01]KRO27453.1 pseudouridylate synthase [Lactiplantibacillus fabifermentans DSM 21115]
MTWTKQLVIPANLNNWTVRDCLKHWLIPKRIQGQLRQGHRILVNDLPASVATVVHENDQLTLTFIESDFRTPTSNYLPDSAATVQILYQTPDLIVVNKPAGEKAHPNQPGEVGSVLNHLAAYLAPEHQAPYMVHRLDQMTSGAMLVALNPIVVPILDRLISDKSIHRTYYAWVRGHFDQPSGQFTNPIGHHPTDKRKRWIDTPDAQSAVTDYQVIKTGSQHTLVKLDLQTGRTHQLRVHLAANGHPIIGDPLYDSLASGNSRLFLHAIQLLLQLPFSDDFVTVNAPLPAVFDVEPN